MKYLSYEQYLKLVKQVIGEKRLTISEIADKARLDRRFVSSIVNGKSTHNARLIKIGKAVGVPAKEYFSVEGK